jgi:hypothetical protein
MLNPKTPRKMDKIRLMPIPTLSRSRKLTHAPKNLDIENARNTNPNKTPRHLCNKISLMWGGEKIAKMKSDTPKPRYMNTKGP